MNCCDSDNQANSLQDMLNDLISVAKQFGRNDQKRHIQKECLPDGKEIGGRESIDKYWSEYLEQEDEYIKKVRDEIEEHFRKNRCIT